MYAAISIYKWTFWYFCLRFVRVKLTFVYRKWNMWQSNCIAKEYIGCLIDIWIEIVGYLYSALKTFTWSLEP